MAALLGAASADLGTALGDAALGAAVATGPGGAEVATALCLLAEQAAAGIDYAKMRLGWHHPDTRAEYRDNVHPSQASSRARQQRSLASLRADARVAADAASPANAQQALVSAFVREIGLAPDSTPGLAAVFCGCIAALRAELLHPLRALQEGRGAMEKTMNGQPVPRKPIDAAVDALLEAVLAGRYSDWRYENPFGKAQLHGLTPSQVAAWRAPASSRRGELRAREGEISAEILAASQDFAAEFLDGFKKCDTGQELGFFWATKIGGPSHGFDYEPQCLLPLLCNARNKVVTVDDPAWPQNPSGRAHLRLLHRPEADGGGALLWLEETHADFRAARHVDSNAHAAAILAHAIGRSCELKLPLYLDASNAGLLRALLAELTTQAAGCFGSVSVRSDALELRPSNGVLEASDFLSQKHDWVQLKTEVLPPVRRAVFAPASPVAVAVANKVEL
mmetsp:Transcript_20599/g.51517  ORF Transcript_20599/g.51517 Transcript_20599/m.51517 type:complete len:451 (-) Transcript_20599:84-1436(-)